MRDYGQNYLLKMIAKSKITVVLNIVTIETEITVIKIIVIATIVIKIIAVVIKMIAIKTIVVRTMSLVHRILKRILKPIAIQMKIENLDLITTIQTVEIVLLEVIEIIETIGIKMRIQILKIM